MYALIDYIGSQILIKEGDKIKIPFLDQKVGSKVVFKNVLFFDDGKKKKIGTPYLESLSFSGKIESHGKEKKIIVFKKKRRKGHQKKNGHQQQFTYVTIDKFSKSKTTKKTPAKTKAASKPKKTTKSKGSK
jgi:large subunit ribosomal protein L21